MDFNIFKSPSLVFAETEQGWEKLMPAAHSVWSAGHVAVNMKLGETGTDMGLYLESKELAVHTIRIRWNHRFAKPVTLFGDHWERGYGDMGWSGLQPERVMPWYFMIHDGSSTAGFGVKTGAGSMCCWQVDADGVTLTADVSSGSQGVTLGNRILQFAELVQVHGGENMTPYETTRMLCSSMCDHPVLPSAPVYGGNNWYYAYGKSSHHQIVEDSRFISAMAEGLTNRPFMVIDDGWQISSGTCNGGPWVGNRGFPDMAGLADEMKQAGVRPGIWCRPLLTQEKVPESWIRYTKGGHFLDPSRPDVLEYVAETMSRLHEWGYELIKHDFSTFDLFGQWGFQMKGKAHALPYALSDTSRTTAEIVLDLYRTIAEASKDSLIIGCNTIGHLAAGLFEIQRTGDDTSGRSWERTRRMGVNTLAFRMPQHGTLFSHDADCVGITSGVPWEFNRQWLDLLANSGTPLFVSADQKELSGQQKREVRQAFEAASRPLPAAEPLDWMYNSCPSLWKISGETRNYSWNGEAVLATGTRDHEWWR